MLKKISDFINKQYKIISFICGYSYAILNNYSEFRSYLTFKVPIQDSLVGLAGFLLLGYAGGLLMIGLPLYLINENIEEYLNEKIKITKLIKNISFVIVFVIIFWVSVHKYYN